MHLLPYPHLKLDKKTIAKAITISCVGLILSLLLCLYIKTKTDQEDQIRFEYEAKILSRKISSWLEQYSAMLVQTRAFVLNTNKFNPKKLYRYIEATEVFKRYSGLQGIGYVPVLDVRKIKQFKTEYPEVKIWPEYDRQTAFVTPILGIYPPTKKNKLAMGYNISSEKVRSETLAKARDTDSIVAAAKVSLIQESKVYQHPSFILFIPIYEEGAKIASVQERRDAIRGYLFSPFRTFDLFNSIFSEVKMVVDIKIYNSHDHKNEDLLYEYSNNKINSNNDQDIKIPISIEGMDLTLVFSPLENFHFNYNPLSLVIIFLLAISVTFIAVWTFLITTKQVMEARRVAAQKETLLILEIKQVQDRDEFLSIASHELKTPLTALKLQAQIMMRNLNKDNQEFFSKEKISNLVKLLDVQSSRLNRLVDDMLDISRLRTGKLHINLTQTDLKEVIDAVLEKLASQFFEANLDVPKIEIEQNIIGTWDRLRIEQVITNLMSNAIRYGNSKPMRVKAYKDSQFAYIEIIDQGRGISTDKFEIIFNRFERAGMSAHESSGLGLGLYIAKQIVQAHGGDIFLNSELQKGTTFTVKLPL